MNEETWSRVSEVVAQALEEPPELRSAFLDRIARREPEIRREAEVLLSVDTAALDAADRPVFQLFGVSEAVETPPAGPPGPPTTAGPYALGESLGAGGMSDVFAGRRLDGGPPRDVAIKVLKRGRNPELIDRLRQEGDILGRLQHPHIAAVYGAGSLEDGRPFLVMERVRGAAVDQYCRRSSLDLEGRLRLFLQVCAAVSFAHRNLVVHRDLKPSNILVTADGHAKLLDFGISKLLSSPDGLPTTATGLLWLTPEYAAPEQVRGEAVNVASDIHGLGVVLFQILTGRLPFERSTMEGLLHQVCFEDAPRPSLALTEAGFAEIGRPGGAVEVWRRRLRGDLDAMLGKAMRKEPELRYATVDELADDVRRFLDLRPVRARSGNLTYRVSKALRRHRVVAATLVVSGLIVGLSAMERVRVYQALQDESRRAVATRDLLLELFKNADPDAGRGEDLTVREVMEEGVRRIDRLEDQPRLQGYLLNTVGHIYASLGRLDDAESLARRALHVHTQTLPDALSEAHSRRLLGRVLSEAGRFKGADAELRRALRLYGDDATHLGERAEIHTTLALNLQYQGRSEQASAEIHRGLELYEAAGQERSGPMALAINNLGYILFSQGDPAGAVAAFERALELQGEIYGRDHPVLALAAANLGAVEGMRGRYDAAQNRLDEALGIWSRTLGEDDRLTLTTRFNKAALYFEADRPGPALAGSRALLPTVREKLGPRHPLVIDILQLEANALAARDGDPETVAGLRRQVLELCLEVYGRDHPKTAAALYDRAKDVEDRDPAQAVLWLEEALAVEEAHLGVDAEATRVTREKLQEVRRRLAGP